MRCTIVAYNVILTKLFVVRQVLQKHIFLRLYFNVLFALDYYTAGDGLHSLAAD